MNSKDSFEVSIVGKALGQDIAEGTSLDSIINTIKIKPEEVIIELVIDIDTFTIIAEAAIEIIEMFNSFLFYFIYIFISICYLNIMCNLLF